MKTAAKYIASVFLSLMILTVSGGFTLSRMVCLESGYTLYALSEQGDCCENQNLPPVRFEVPCCDIVNQTVAVDDYTPSFAKILKCHLLLTTVIIPSAKFFPDTVDEAYLTFNISSLPPPLSGVDFLHTIHKLTV